MLTRGEKVYGTNQYQEYEVVDQIGRGGFGMVFKVASTKDGNYYAVKTFQMDYQVPSEQRALFNEARNSIVITHPNVVKVIYFHDGTVYKNLPPYILMEYVDGGTLERLMQNQMSQGFFSNIQLVDMFNQLANGMYAISQRFVHRDIKPDNILVDGTTLKISDFGLSKIVDAATRSETMKGYGDRRYYAPEAWRAEKHTNAMDIYAMGIVFFQLASLRFPYVQPANGDWKSVHMFHQPQSLESINANLDVSLSQMIHKMMSKSPQDRYNDWNEIQNKLKTFGNTPSPSPSRINDLVKLAGQTQRSLEKKQLEEVSRLEQQLERENLTKYSVEQLLNVIKRVVSEFNDKSELMKLNVAIYSDYHFAIEQANRDSANKITIQLKTDNPLPQLTQMMQFNRIDIKAWGLMTSPSKYGYNVALISKQTEDMYGLWYVFQRSLSYPNFTNSNPKPIPYSIEEMPSELRNASNFRQQFAEEHVHTLIHDLVSDK